MTVEPGSLLCGVSLPELRLSAEATVTLVVRADTAFEPGPNTRLRAGDHLLVRATPPGREATQGPAAPSHNL